MTQKNRISVCIVSFSGDAHANIVAAILKKRHGACVKIMHPENCQDTVSLSYGVKSKGEKIIYDVTWVRRKNFLYLTPGGTTDLDLKINVAQSNQDALDTFITRSSHRLVNPIEKAARIENKATQLGFAESSGLKAPSTLISSSYTKIMEFESEHGPLVIKSMRSIGGAPTGTFLFDAKHMSPEACSWSHAIYQEKISGSKHLRVAVFGSKILPFLYESNHLDSRFDARSGAILIDIPESLSNGILRFMDISGLRMGVFDFKQSDAGEWYFLEVNQQGAFAYLDPLSGYPILLDFAKFIADEASIR